MKKRGRKPIYDEPMGTLHTNLRLPTRILRWLRGRGPLVQVLRDIIERAYKRENSVQSQDH